MKEDLNWLRAELRRQKRQHESIRLPEYTLWERVVEGFRSLVRRIIR